MNIISAAWSANTSADPDWTPCNPALGQCAVTALVVQDLLGGELLRGTVDGVSHYWNRLAGGTELDLTRVQFPPGSRVGGAEVRSREYVLSFDATRVRYVTLRSRVAALMEAAS